jgi:hypothetical protein
MQVKQNPVLVDTGHYTISHTKSVLTFGVVMVVSICLLCFLLTRRQHIVEGVMTDALPTAEKANMY